MPPTLPNNAQWLSDQIAALRADVTALKSQSTKYICDPSGACLAIIGDVTHDTRGVPTGLAGWGFASFKTGSWVKL